MNHHAITFILDIKQPTVEDAALLNNSFSTCFHGFLNSIKFQQVKQVLTKPSNINTNVFLEAQFGDCFIQISTVSTCNCWERCKFLSLIKPCKRCIVHCFLSCMQQVTDQEMQLQHQHERHEEMIQVKPCIMTCVWFL